MKIIHTSDWHLGKKLYDKDLTEDHLFFFENLIEIINKEQVQVLIISGDIFDTAYPPNSSLQLYYKTLTRLQKTCLQEIIIVGGNHDSISTINAPKEILSFLNIKVFGGVPKTQEDEPDFDKQIIEIKNEKGKVELVVVAIPFLRERDIRKSVAGESFDTKRQAVISGIEEHFGILSEKVSGYRNAGIPVVATGHLFVAGAKPSDSEREIYIGNQEKITGEFLTGKFDYIALGHIHKPYIIGNNPSIRYSGSPIPLSFSEHKDEKSVVLIDFKGNIPDIKTVKIPYYRNLYRLKGTLDEVLIKFSSKVFDKNTKDIFEIEVEEETFSPEIKHKYQEFTEEYTNLIISKKLRFNDQISNISDLYSTTETLSEIEDFEVFSRLLDKNELSGEVRTEFESMYKYLKETLETETEFDTISV